MIMIKPEADEEGGIPQSADSWQSTLFEPQKERSESMPKRTSGEAPEKKLTLFALRLAILEKSASGIGTLGFIWATVVLLGGFAVTLETKDFWFVTVILLIEGTRIFSRSHELEWQHQATWSLSDTTGTRSFRAVKSSSRYTINAVRLSLQRIATLSKNADISRNISRILYWLQIISASSCAFLSWMRLTRQDYGRLDKDRKNLKSALDIFYSLALAEALLFLTEKAYWEWEISYHRLLEEVNSECNLGNSGIVSVTRFFYDSYSRCINGSIFDGLKMDLVSFSTELLASTSRDEQLIGARILHKFVSNPHFSDETIWKISTSTPVIERLIEMLNWKNPTEEEIRRLVAIIVSKLTGKKQNALRVAGIPGALESISSLLFTGRCTQSGPHDRENFNLLGLLILKKLANDHDNCGKIGNTRGLLAKIIDFTSTGDRLCRRESMTESQVRAVKRSLQMVKMLASTTGNTGRSLRKEIAEIVFTVSNIREILQYGGDHVILQRLGIEIVTSLAMDEEARERIGITGGMMRELLRIFFREGCATEEESSVRVEAGEALAMLALENEKNCLRILKEKDVVERLVSSLDHPLLRISSFRILKNLCAFHGTECLLKLRGVTNAIPLVLNAIMVEETKLLEVSLGLATQIFRFTSSEEYVEELEKAGIEEVRFADRLVQLLRMYKCPSIKVPRVRRFVIELATWLMKSDTKYVRFFDDLGMEEELWNVTETTTELECFNVFSGSVGLSRHDTTVSRLVDTALELISGSNTISSWQL